MKPVLKDKNPFTLVKPNLETSPEKSEKVTSFLSKIKGEDNYETILAVRVLQVLPPISSKTDEVMGFDVVQTIEAMSQKFNCSNYPSADVYASLGFLYKFGLIEIGQNIFNILEDGESVVETVCAFSTIDFDFRIFTRSENESMPEHFELSPDGKVAGKRYKHLFSIL